MPTTLTLSLTHTQKEQKLKETNTKKTIQDLPGRRRMLVEKYDVFRRKQKAKEEDGIMQGMLLVGQSMFHDLLTACKGHLTRYKLVIEVSEQTTVSTLEGSHLFLPMDLGLIRSTTCSEICINDPFFPCSSSNSAGFNGL
jgi:hypothetical protein